MKGGLCMYDKSFMMESIELDIFLLEKSEELFKGLDSIKIKMMEESVSDNDDMYLEASENAFIKFIKEIIKKIREIAEAIKKKFKNFITQKELEAELKRFAKEYGKNKARYTGKKIQFFDQMKYTNACIKYINEFKKIAKTLAKEEFYSAPEMMQYKMGKWIEIINKNVDVALDMNRFINIDEFNKVFFEYERSLGVYAKCADMIQKEYEGVINLFKDAASNASSATQKAATKLINIFTRAYNLMINKLFKGSCSNVSAIQKAMKN